MKKTILLFTFFLLVAISAKSQYYQLGYDSVRIKSPFLLGNVTNGNLSDLVLVIRNNGRVYSVNRSTFTSDGTVTSVGKIDGYGIVSSIANPTTTPVITMNIDSGAVNGPVSKNRLLSSLALYAKLSSANTFTSNQIIPRLAIGSGSLTATNLRVDGNITGAATSHGVYIGGQIQSDVTTTAIMFRSNPSSINSTFTTSSVVGYRAFNLSKGASHTVTNQYGMIIDDLSAGTNNYAIASTVTSGSGKWNWYGSGTASNYSAGKWLIGTLTDNGEILQVQGKVTVSTAPTNATDVVRKTELDTKEAITIVNTSLNTTQTSASLNSLYPSALVGQTILAPNVGTGMRYQKTTTTGGGTWVAQATTNI